MVNTHGNHIIMPTNNNTEETEEQFLRRLINNYLEQKVFDEEGALEWLKNSLEYHYVNKNKKSLIDKILDVVRTYNDE